MAARAVIIVFIVVNEAAVPGRFVILRSPPTS
jgi:hypothetical protein